MKSFILSKTALLLFPITVLFALYLLLRGHNQPGGGFSAALVITLTLVILSFAFGVRGTMERLAFLYRPLVWLGLLLAFGAGVGPMLAGEPFLTHHHVTLGWVRDAEISLSTTLLFDTGIFATVLGAVSSALAALVGGRAT